MNKKLQVFISSTFTDLQEERQAAVEAVLKAGHIPAGMELFKPADESQKETISRWIKDSDVYLLILGGRYGTIEPTSKKSYTHWEYDLAGELGIPRFALVISDKALEIKAKNHGQSVLEMENQKPYTTFKKNVLNKTSGFFDDMKDIKLEIIGKLNDYAKDEKLAGWISGRDVKGLNEISQTVIELIKENNQLKETVANLKMTKVTPSTPASSTYDDGIVNFGERVGKILAVLGATLISSASGISWLIDETENDEDNEIYLPHPPNDFEAYFVINTEDIYEKLFIVCQIKDVDELQARFGDIRVLLNEYNSAEGVPIKFVIAIPGQHGELQERASIFLEKAKTIVALKDESLFDIEVWDSNVVDNFEAALGFRV